MNQLGSRTLFQRGGMLAPFWLSIRLAPPWPKQRFAGSVS